MPEASKIREIDLKPYQTYFLFQSEEPLTSKRLAQLLDELPAILTADDPDDEDKYETITKNVPRRIQEEQLAWLAYRKSVPVRWMAGPDAPTDLEHHLIILMARSSILSVVATDKGLPGRLRKLGARKGWSALKRIPFRAVEKALVSGTTRTLWLSGIHRSVATKPDSKVLIGPDIEASLDALGDQTYQYTSTRCEGPSTLPASFVGVTPRMGKVWMGPSANWEVFLANSQQLLRLIEKPGGKKQEPYPVLARAEGTLHDVKEAFDVSFAAPEYLYEEDPDLVAQLEKLTQETSWSVKGEAGANCTLTVKMGGVSHDFEIKLRTEGQEIRHTVEAVEENPPEEVQKIAALCNRTDLLKIFYDSAHTYSDNQMFEVRTRPFPFAVNAIDFSHYDVTLEKPHPLGKDEGVDLQRIGDPGEPSLFTWASKHYKRGWLWCDDGSGEIADFIHLDEAQSLLSLIHIKAAHSDSDKRGISVSAYEVVCSQALKNLRYTERRELEAPLKAKITRVAGSLVRGWRNGKALPPKSLALWAAIKNVRYSNLRRRVIVVQPHVRKSILPKDLSAKSSSSRQAQLLFTLLHAVKADVDRYGAEFEVIVAK
jgi:hypothetical protein